MFYWIPIPVSKDKTENEYQHNCRTEIDGIFAWMWIITKLLGGWMHL